MSDPLKIIPAGYAKVTWEKLQAGVQVWIHGSHQGMQRAYGPHEVASVADRTLKSGSKKPHNGRIFKYYLDDLLIQC